MNEGKEDGITSMPTWRQVLKRVNPFSRKTATATSTVKPPPIIDTEAVSPKPVQVEPISQVEKIIPPPIEEAVQPLPEPAIQQPDLVTPAPLQNVEQQENIKPANTIYYHTTVLDDMPAIQKDGLYSLKGHDILGRDLMYSLYFDREYEGSLSIRPKARGGNKNTFALTLWKDSPHIKRVGNDMWHWGTGRLGQFKATEPVAGHQDLPESYVASGLGGPVHPSTEFARVSPSEFLAGITINQQLKDDLIAAQLKFVCNVNNADNIETQLKQALDGTCNLNEGYALDQLTHDLMANIEQTVLAAGYGPHFQEVLKSIDENNHSVETVARAIQEIENKLASVNEPISKRYLQAWRKKFETALEQKGLTKQVEDTIKWQRRDRYGRHNFKIYYDLDIWCEGLRDAMRIAKDLGFE